ncbi:hypothetical protein PR002_g12906 [Phytophthora rubi]|uniref:Transketolase-like pyrimidine-binding domain-containing protein n=2 Tax=Phytophthora rubi TaxID=129364 RepID=A0A6A3LS69_9STRA|nr:hypothetical protein PR002_g12906 [Phytophthora rubi]
MLLQAIEVREHGMAAISNGLFAHNNLRPFCATFYIDIGTLWVPSTHQPIEMNASLRAMPNMYVYRPADGNETVSAYIAAVGNAHKTSVIALTSQGLKEAEEQARQPRNQAGQLRGQRRQQQDQARHHQRNQLSSSSEREDHHDDVIGHADGPRPPDVAVTAAARFTWSEPMPAVMASLSLGSMAARSSVM